MSQENVEVVRRLLAVWEGDAQIASLRDDAAWARYKPGSSRFSRPIARLRGSEAVSGPSTAGSTVSVRVADIYEAWESARNHFEQIVPVDDKVLVLVRLYGRIVGAEHEVETLAAGVFVVRDGRVARAEFYADRARALEAVRLSE